MNLESLRLKVDALRMRKKDLFGKNKIVKFI